MPDVASVDGIGDESQEMAVDITGADEVIDGIMDVENDNVFVEEFIEDLPIQDEPEEQYPLNQEALEEEEEDIWKVPSDELFLELDYLMKCLDNHFQGGMRRRIYPLRWRQPLTCCHCSRIQCQFELVQPDPEMDSSVLCKIQENIKATFL